MYYKKFSKKELSDILDIIHSSVICKNETEAILLLERTGALVCGDYSICGIGRGGGNGLTDISKVINGNYPEEWLKLYAGSRLYLQDPIIWQSLKSPGAQLWDETYGLYSGDLTHDFISKARDFGLCHGVSVSFGDGCTGLSTIFTFSGRHKRYSAHQKSILSIIGPHLHQALLRLCRDSQASPAYVLSKREKEVMNWMKEGKTNWEIGIILNISERTVKFHVQNIEKKLNAVNKAHAIAIALDQNLVSC